MACPCPCCGLTGACCVGESCTQETCADCETLGGLWQGVNTECVSGDCPCDPPADHTACEKCQEGTTAPRCSESQYCCDGVCQNESCVGWCDGVCVTISLEGTMDLPDSTDIPDGADPSCTFDGPGGSVSFSFGPKRYWVAGGNTYRCDDGTWTLLTSAVEIADSDEITLTGTEGWYPYLEFGWNPCGNPSFRCWLTEPSGLCLEGGDTYEDGFGPDPFCSCVENVDESGDYEVTISRDDVGATVRTLSATFTYDIQYGGTQAGCDCPNPFP